jgi:Dolichyl-phosphate-mannose-protein mannosyltransferase
MPESQPAATAFGVGAKETSGEPPISARARALLALTLGIGLAASATGLDWGLPYQWHTDEKVTQAINVLHSPRLDPDYFINPHLHIYLVAAAFKIAYTIDPGYEVGQGFPEILPMMDRASPARKLQFLAMRLSRAESVLFGLATILLVFVVGRRHWGEGAGVLAAAFAAVTMGLVNLWHFATPEGLLFLLILAALGLMDRVMARGAMRDYALTGACIGLACSTKYTAWLLAVPFLTAHLAGRGARGAVHLTNLRNVAVAGAAAAIAFLAGTPLIVVDWSQFWEWGVVYNWYTGAPTGSLVEGTRSYGPYLGLLGNGLGWPLFALGLAGLVLGGVHLWLGDRRSAAGRGYLIHAMWVTVFYAFYGLSPHHALRFIMPIAPSLVLLAAAASVRLIERQYRPAAKRLAMASVAAVLIYSAVYTARADDMFLHDSRYAAGAWLDRTLTAPGARLDYFAIEAYLPYFDHPPFALHFVPFMEHATLHHEAFWSEARSYLQRSDAPIVDSNFYYDRYLDDPRRFPERADLYRHLLTGTDPSGFRPVARFTFENPRWLNPRPERVAPDVVVFGKAVDMKTPRQD